MSKAMLALIFSNGKMYEGSEGLMYDGPSPKVLNIERGISLDYLKQRIHSKLKLQASQVVSTVIYRFPVWCNVLKFIALKLEDDEDVVCMFNSYEQHPNLTSVDIYVEVEVSPGNVDSTSATTRENERLNAHGSNLESEIPPVRDKLLHTIKDEDIAPDEVVGLSSDVSENGNVDADANLQAKVSSSESMGTLNSSPTMSAPPGFNVPPSGQTTRSSEYGPSSLPWNVGPDDPSLLVLQSVHCSQYIWNGEDDRVLRVRRSHIKGHDPPPGAVVPYLQIVGFYGVACLGFIQVDRHLISAFVERWRPETHTFHTPQGECTITLQDVSIQMGLPIDGLPVTGVTLDDWEGLCGRLLGAVPPPSTLMGGRLSMSWLDEQFRELPENASDVTVQQFARAYMLRLIGGVIFADKSGRVHLMFLHLLEDFQVARSYSWGSACLAYLYRELCRATNYDARDIGGACLLLQLWAWDRFPHIAPKRLGVTRENNIPEREEHDHALPGPLGCRWRCSKKAATHVISQYRYHLDRLKVSEIIWQPYADDIVNKNLPDYCLTGSEIWCAVVPLICFHIVEWHQPDRVMRQFGHSQPIPQQPCQPLHLHDVNLRGCNEVHWPTEHSQYISIWENRHNLVVIGEPLGGYLSSNSEYMRWYWGVTRRWIGREGAVPRILADNVERMHDWSTPQGRPAFSFDGLQQSCKNILSALDEHNLVSTCPQEPVPPAKDTPRPSEGSVWRHGQQRQLGLFAVRRHVECPQTHGSALNMMPSTLKGEQVRSSRDPSTCARGTKRGGSTGDADFVPSVVYQVINLPKPVQTPPAKRVSSSGSH